MLLARGLASGLSCSCSFGRLELGRFEIDQPAATAQLLRLQPHLLKGQAHILLLLWRPLFVLLMLLLLLPGWLLLDCCWHVCYCLSVMLFLLPVK